MAFGVSDSDFLAGPGPRITADEGDGPRVEPLRVAFDYELVDIPRVSMMVAAGPGNIAEEDVADTVPFRSDWIVRTFGTFSDHEQVRRRLCLVTVARDKTGVSMEPDIRRGSLCLVDRREITPATMVDAKPYLIRRDESDITLKYARQARGGVLCWGPNSEPFNVLLEQGESLSSRVRGRVVWWASYDLEGYQEPRGTWYRRGKR